MAGILFIKTRSGSDRPVRYPFSPPLGLMSLAAYARVRRPGRDRFRIVDERITPLDDGQYSELIREFEPDVLAINAISIGARRLEALTGLLKTLAPALPVLAGGPYVSSAGKKLFRTARVDYAVLGEGEIPFVRLLERFDAGHVDTREAMAGVMARNPDGTITDGGPHGEFLDSRDIPMPAWDLVDLHPYAGKHRMTPLAVAGPWAPLFTSRGCPFGCIYCHNIFGRKFRPRSPMQVVDEIEHLNTAYGIESFEIFDDIFNLDYGRVMEICAEIKRRGLKTRFSFPNALRADLLDERMISELRSVGTYSMALAVESASPRVQKMINKNLDQEKVKENIGIATSQGILTWGFFMLGFPTESFGEIWRTIRFALGSRLNGAFFFLVVPQEGTRLASMFGKSALDDPALFGRDYFFSRNSLSLVGGRQLDLLQSLAFFLFYFDPRRMFRIFRNCPPPRVQLLKRALRLGRLLVFKIMSLLAGAKAPDGEAAPAGRCPGKQPSQEIAGGPAVPVRKSIH